MQGKGVSTTTVTTRESGVTNGPGASKGGSNSAPAPGSVSTRAPGPRTSELSGEVSTRFHGDPGPGADQSVATHRELTGGPKRRLRKLPANWPPAVKLSTSPDARPFNPDEYLRAADHIRQHAAKQRRAG